jgi:glycosyltransferase involved in cell wall biosynthesis
LLGSQKLTGEVMKILYVAGRWDPTIQTEYSGSDYGAYHMLKKQPGVEVFLVGPMDDQPNFIEKVITKLYRIFFKKRLIKYYPSSLREIGKVVNQAITDIQPDVIFSKYSAPLVHAKIDRPFVYMCDSTVKWTQEFWPDFSKLGFKIMEKWEAKSIRACDRLITFSKASADVIVDYYQKDPAQVRVLPIPAYVPNNILPSKETIHKAMDDSLHLLLVGKRFHLRGVDIAIEVTQLLNEKNIPTKLRIVGMSGEDQAHVKFIGVFNKEDQNELQAYFDFFRWADLLIHPSRFHSAGIVISEAAGFGLPTITNAAGGLGTTVQHDRTGLVLPENSPPTAYVDAITSLINDKKRYQQYCATARGRFDEELNWERAGVRLFEIILEVLQA